MQIPALILAAGASRRLGQPKQLLPLAGRPLLLHMIERAHTAGCAPVLVLTGAHADRVEPLLADLEHVRAVHNESWQDGQGSTVAVGMQTVRNQYPDSQGVLVMLCDQPHVTVKHLQGLCDTIRDGHAVAATRYPEGGGVPACFGTACLADLSNLRGDTGARRWINDCPHDVQLLTPSYKTADIDVPDDLDALQGPD